MELIYKNLKGTLEKVAVTDAEVDRQLAKLQQQTPRVRPITDRAAQAGDESQSGSLTAFERLCDNTLTAYFAKARTVVFGEQVVIAYLCALETEIAAARMIVNGLQIGLPADTIRTRLRELYF